MTVLVPGMRFPAKLERGRSDWFLGSAYVKGTITNDLKSQQSSGMFVTGDIERLRKVRWFALDQEQRECEERDDLRAHVNAALVEKGVSAEADSLYTIPLGYETALCVDDQLGDLVDVGTVPDGIALEVAVQRGIEDYLGVCVQQRLVGVGTADTYQQFTESTLGPSWPYQLCRRLIGFYSNLLPHNPNFLPPAQHAQNLLNFLRGSRMVDDGMKLYLLCRNVDLTLDQKVDLASSYLRKMVAIQADQFEEVLDHVTTIKQKEKKYGLPT